MKKALLTKLTLLLCALIAGSSSVWADGTLISALNGITSGDTYYIAALNSDKYYTVPNTTINGQTFTCTEGSYNTTTTTLTTPSGAGEFVLTAVSNVANAYYIYNTNLSKYLVATASKKFGYVDNTDANYGYWTFSTVSSGGFSGAFSIQHKDNSNADKTQYIRAYNNSVRCYDSASNSGIYLFKKVATSNPMATLSATSLAFGRVKAGESKNLTFTVTPANLTSNLSIASNNAKYTVSPTSIAQATTTATTITVTAAPTATSDDMTGSVTISGGGLSENKTVSLSCVVRDPAANDGTAAKPYTVAEARVLIDEAGSDKTNIHVSGIVSQIDSYNDQYHSITYWISDDGTTTDQLEVYSGKGLSGADFDGISGVPLGDNVVVKGNLKKFNTTYEFEQNNELVTQKHATAPVIDANNVTIEFDATSGEIPYNVSNSTSATLAAVITEGDWISNLNVAADKVTFTATENTGAQRTATITLSYAGATDRAITITQKACEVATLPFAFDGGKNDIDNTFGLTQNGLGSDYGSSPKLKFDGTGDYVILRTNAAIGTLVFDIKGNGFSSGSTSTFKVQTSTDGTSYSDLATYTALDDTETKVFNLDDDVRYVKWIYTEKGSSSGGNVAIGNINTETVNVTITDADYATFVLATKKVNFGATDVKAYTAKVNGSYVTLTEIKKVPENTPVVVFKDVDAETTVKVPVTGNATAVAADANDLLVSDGTATTDNSYNVYALANKSNTIGFYKVQAGVTVPAGKAYLKIAVANPAPEFLGFGETTGINEVRGKMEDVSGKVYNLAGQRVAQPTKGLYIVNGKKVIMK